MPYKNYISNSVIRRLPRYYRFLGDLQKEGLTKISSFELSARMKLTASQIRQDLNCFGGFGMQGYGYNVAELRSEIGKIIGVERKIGAILIGAGNLGKAIITYFDFPKYGCELIGIFDNNSDLVDSQIAGVTICHISKLAAFCKKSKPEIAVLCIPKENAGAISEMLVDCGVKAFWNFSHYDINLHFDDIIVENVHMGDSLLTLAYNVNNKNK
ncbi:MAG: redox-sensing transcriptional repressor Rex [Oscillospiraceae bacterium]|jgi:redox-sensing transcriptional repressor|nr:redox-sensing transcriptional repressor Rex [Oscillospiraceae bacterium]